MKFKHLLAIACAFLIGLQPMFSSAEQVPLSRTGKLDVLFSPQDNIGAALVSPARYLANKNVPVWINQRESTLRQNFLLCDTGRVAFGSAVFTMSSMGGPATEKDKADVENFNLFDGFPSLNKLYAAQFTRLLADSIVFTKG